MNMTPIMLSDALFPCRLGFCVLLADISFGVNSQSQVTFHKPETGFRDHYWRGVTREMVNDIMVFTLMVDGQPRTTYYAIFPGFRGHYWLGVWVGIVSNIFMVLTLASFFLFTFYMFVRKKH